MKLTREAHEVGYQVSAETLKGQFVDVMVLVPLRIGLEKTETADELLGYVKGASRALLFSFVNSDLYKKFMNAYLDGVYKHLDIKNPLKEC